MKTADITDLQVVENCAYAQLGGFRCSALAALMHRTGAPEKVAWGALERAANRGLIECGVSLRCAWPTAKGRAMLSSPPVA